MKALRAVFYTLFAIAAFLGAIVFGPPEYTSMVKEHELFKTFVDPYLQMAGLSTGVALVQVGTVESVNGQVMYQEAGKDVFEALAVGQKVHGGGIVNAPDKSEAKIKLIDNTVVTVNANSMLTLQLPEGATQATTVTLNVTKGSIAGERVQGSGLDIKVSQNGRMPKRVLPQQRLDLDSSIAEAQPENRMPASQEAPEVVPVESAHEAPAAQTAPAVEDPAKAQMRREALARAGESQIVPLRIPARPRGGYYAAESRSPASLGDLEVWSPSEADVPVAAKSFDAPKSFDKKTRKGTDAMMRDYVANNKCQQGQKAISKVESLYPNEPIVSKWSKYWSHQFKKKGCL